MKFKIVIIILLVVVCSGFNNKISISTTGAGGSSGPDKIGENQGMGMVIIESVYYSYTITNCKILKGRLLLLDGKGLTDKGQPFNISTNVEENLIEVNLSAFDHEPAISYISVPLSGIQVEFEITNRIVSTKVSFRRVGHAKLLSGIFRAECR